MFWTEDSPGNKVSLDPEIHPTYLQSVRSMLGGRLDGQRFDQSSCNKKSGCQVLQSCFTDKWDQVFSAVPKEKVHSHVLPLQRRITSDEVMCNCVLQF